jgi:hypothetical protein
MPLMYGLRFGGGKKLHAAVVWKELSAETDLPTYVTTHTCELQRR